MLKPSLYKHIIWDWNGTLLNDAWLFVDIMNDILRSRNMNTITLEKYREIFGFPVRKYYRTLGFDIEKESFRKSGLEFINAYKKRRYEAKLYPMANSILAKLSAKSINHSILSAQQQDLLDDLTKYYEIQNYFQYIDGLNDYYAESKIEEGLKLIKKTGYNPQNILFIGDTEHDYEVAKAIDADCLLLSHGHNCHKRLIHTGAPVIRNLEDISHIFAIDVETKGSDIN